jgi:hypothetical protein
VFALVCGPALRIHSLISEPVIIALPFVC